MRQLVIGGVYRHFKGKYYRVEGTARDAATGETAVLYRALYGEGELWVRPLSEFLSPTDKEKYPDAAQDERFCLEEKA